MWDKIVLEADDKNQNLGDISDYHCDENEDVFWDVVLCSLVGIDQCFRDCYCLHHQVKHLKLKYDVWCSNGPCKQKVEDTLEGCVLICGCILVYSTAHYQLHCLYSSGYRHTTELLEPETHNIRVFSTLETVYRAEVLRYNMQVHEILHEYMRTWKVVSLREFNHWINKFRLNLVLGIYIKSSRFKPLKP
jgi:hypothetical protein